MTEPANAPRCAGCNQPISAGWNIELGDKWYCFKCYVNRTAVAAQRAIDEETKLKPSVTEGWTPELVLDFVERIEAAMARFEAEGRELLAELRRRSQEPKGE